jgi:hypothetical protein
MVVNKNTTVAEQVHLVLQVPRFFDGNIRIIPRMNTLAGIRTCRTLAASAAYGLAKATQFSPPPLPFAPPEGAAREGDSEEGAFFWRHHSSTSSSVHRDLQLLLQLQQSVASACGKGVAYTCHIGAACGFFDFSSKVKFVLSVGFSKQRCAVLADISVLVFGWPPARWGALYAIFQGLNCY